MACLDPSPRQPIKLLDGGQSVLSLHISLVEAPRSKDLAVTTGWLF